MGSEEEEVTQIALHLEGISICVTARRPRAASAPTVRVSSPHSGPSPPLHSSVIPGARQAPVEVASSTSSASANRAAASTASAASLQPPVSPGVGQTPVVAPTLHL